MVWTRTPVIHTPAQAPHMKRRYKTRTSPMIKLAGKPMMAATGAASAQKISMMIVRIIFGSPLLVQPRLVRLPRLPQARLALRLSARHCGARVVQP